MPKSRKMPKELLEKFKSKNANSKKDAPKKPMAKGSTKKADPLAKARAAKAKKSGK